MQLGVLSSDCCLWAKLKTLIFFNLYLYKQLEYLQYVPILEFVAIILCLSQSIYQMIQGFFYQLLDLYSEFYFLHHISQYRIKFFCFSVIKHKNNSSIYICYTILGISRNFYWEVELYTIYFCDKGKRQLLKSTFHFNEVNTEQRNLIHFMNFVLHGFVWIRYSLMIFPFQIINIRAIISKALICKE